MQISKLHLIINPKNISGQDALLGDAENLLKYTNLDYEISVSTESNPISEIMKNVSAETDTILVYGGDGSVMDVVNSIQERKDSYHPKIKIGVLPGGTANILAKEIGWGSMPIIDIISKIIGGESEVRKIDLGQVNGEIFFLRINVGLTADMITQTSEDEKSSFGIFAYSISAIQRYTDENPNHIQFKLEIDGDKIEQEGISLMINNAGNIGVDGISLFDDISVLDGLLDVVLIKDINALDLVKNGVKKLIGEQELTNIQRWKSKNIVVRLPKQKTVIKDDTEITVEELEISVLAQQLNIIFPKQN